MIMIGSLQPVQVLHRCRCQVSVDYVSELAGLDVQWISLKKYVKDDDHNWFIPTSASVYIVVMSLA